MYCTIQKKERCSSPSYCAATGVLQPSARVAVTVLVWLPVCCCCVRATLLTCTLLGRGYSSSTAQRQLLCTSSFSCCFLSATPPGPRQHSVLVASRLSWSKLVAQIFRRSVLLATVRRTGSTAASNTSLPVLSDPLEELCAASASRCRPLSRRRRIVTTIWPRMYHVLGL